MGAIKEMSMHKGKKAFMICFLTLVQSWETYQWRFWGGRGWWGLRSSKKSGRAGRRSNRRYYILRVLLRKTFTKNHLHKDWTKQQSLFFVEWNSW